MLTERLRAALDMAERLPPEAQDALAAQIERLLRDSLWNAVLNAPEAAEAFRLITADADASGTFPFTVPETLEEEAEEVDDQWATQAMPAQQPPAEAGETPPSQPPSPEGNGEPE